VVGHSRTRGPLVLLYSLEGYLVGHDDDIEITERGVMWLTTGG